MDSIEKLRTKLVAVVSAMLAVAAAALPVYARGSGHTGHYQHPQGGNASGYSWRNW
jgi:hypothetical protein